MSKRLGPKTAAQRTTPSAPKAPTHGETKAITRALQAERETGLTNNMRRIERGKPTQGQPGRATPKVKRKGV